MELQYETQIEAPICVYLARNISIFPLSYIFQRVIWHRTQDSSEWCDMLCYSWNYSTSLITNERQPGAYAVAAVNLERKEKWIKQWRWLPHGRSAGTNSVAEGDAPLLAMNWRPKIGRDAHRLFRTGFCFFFCFLGLLEHDIWLRGNLAIGRAHQSESMQVSESLHTLPRLRPRPEALSRSGILFFCQCDKTSAAVRRKGIACALLLEEVAGMFFRLWRSVLDVDNGK